MINYYFAIYLGHRNIAHSFTYRPSLRFTGGDL